MDAQTNSDRQGAEQAHSALPTNRATPMPKDNEVDEKVIWSDDLAAVLEAASEASAVPLTWFANREFSPEQTKAWLCDTVDNTVADGAFSGELHGIAEEKSGLTVAFTGCGPKSSANAKFLIWCAHFILKHRDSLSDHAATVAELRAEAERLRSGLLRIESLLGPRVHLYDTTSDMALALEAATSTLTGADPT